MDNNPIDLSKLFNFSDTTPLTNVIDLITQMNGVYQQLIASAQASSAQVSTSMQTMQKSIDALEQSLTDADVTTQAGQDTITKGAQVTAKAVSSNEDYKKSLADLTAQIALLQAQQDKLTTSQDTLTKSNTNEAGSINDLKKQLADATTAYQKLGTATDSATKTAALKNITDVNAQLKTQVQVVNDAKKASDFLAGSYNALQAQVTAATKQLKSFEGGVGSNSDQFKVLQKTVADGNAKLKEFDAAIGVNVRNVGDYKGQISQLLPLISNISPALAGAAEAATSFTGRLAAISPVLGLIGGAAAVAVGSITEYFNRTEAGAAQLEETIGEVKGVWNDFLDFIAKRAGDAITPYIQLGKVLLATVSDSAAEGLKLAKQRRDLTKDEIESIPALAQMRLEADQKVFASRDKIDNSEEERLAAIKEANQEYIQIANIKIGLAQRAYDIQVAQNKLDYDDPTLENLKAEAQLKANIINIDAELLESSRRRQSQQQQIELEIKKQNQDNAALLLKSQTDLDNSRIKSDEEANKAILSNLYSTEAERKSAIEKNAADERKINENNANLAIADAKKAAVERYQAQNGADSAPQGINSGVLDFDEILAEQIKKINQDLANSNIATNTAEHNAILANTNTYINKRLDLETQLYNSQKDLDNARLQNEIDTNKKLAAETTTSVGEKIQLLQKAAQDEISISQNTRDKAVAAATDKVLKESLADGQYIPHLVELNAEIDKINQDEANKELKIKQDSSKAIATAITTDYDNRIKEAVNFNKQQEDIAQKALDEQLINNKISLGKYTVQTVTLKANAQQQDFETQTAFYNRELKELEDYYENANLSDEDYAKQKALIQANINKVTGAQLTEEINLVKQAKAQELQVEKQFGQEIVTAVQQIGDNEFQNQQKQISDRVTALQAQEQKELDLAGDNAAAKATITNTYNQKIAVANKELAKSQHDQAVFDRDVALAQIAYKTAVAIAGALPLLSNPVTLAIGEATIALIAATGAVETAVVIAKPIPSYYTGTDSSGEGLALVGERGREIGIERTGDVKVYDRPQLTYLKQGTKILNNSQSEPILRKMDASKMDSIAAQLVDIGIKDLKVTVNSDQKETIAAIKEMTKKFPDIVAQVNEIYQVFDRRGNNEKWVKSKIFSE